ncbi:glycosyltransferase [Loigolactobacillus backii]|uniref:Uncharacterized protein n=2 Tax=Loigolactobacillus backii TaxID=375175 RepID=A0A192H109_9LACO|nr:glycosyltransferase [Loigolactobacillus backii]ANK61927.1 hypothetical protein AYR53_03580 [Loigolactobacillus backii]ANK68879.1 hypothetical protein AYR56_01145 [Loigolactobacillus backii]MDA5386878.1 glycosyltransferase [Loigolactobacillus backii]MDA5389338.1 glycosyltransferase [Loigolactobacillus backii]
MQTIELLYFVDTLALGGIQSLLKEYIDHFPKGQINVTILTLDEDPPSPLEIELQKKITIQRLVGVKLKTPLDFLKFETKLKQYFKQHSNFDIVHAHASSKSFQLLRQAKIAGIPVRIIHSHSTEFTSQNFAKRAVGNLLKQPVKQAANTYFACSQLAGSWLFGDKSSFEVIPNAISLKAFQFSPATRKHERAKHQLTGKKVFAHFGRFTASKNHRQLLTLFAAFCQKEANAYLLLVGNGELMAQVREQVQQLELQSKVSFLGYRTDVAELLQACDVVLLPSFYEGLPIILLEAQAAGVPCVVSDRVTTEVSLAPNYEAISLDAPTVAWTQAMRRALTQPLIQRKSGLNYVRAAGYDINEAAPQMLQLYRQLITENNS